MDYLSQRTLNSGLFNSEETRTLTGISDGRLLYLVKHGIIETAIPKVGKRPVLAFNWFQLLEIKAIVAMREANVSLQKIRVAIQRLESIVDSVSLADNRILICDRDLFFFHHEKQISDFVVQCLTGKNPGQIVMHSILDFNLLASEMMSNKVIDIRERINFEDVA
jgi:hypothetical protein